MMRIKLCGQALMGLAVLLFATAPLTAGVVYEIQVTDHAQSPPKSESIEAAIESHNLKMGIASRGKRSQGDMIYRGDRQEMIVIDHDGKSYMVMDKKTMSEVAGQISGAMAQMQEALKDVPADQRAMVEKMMKQRMPAAVAPAKRSRPDLRKTGDKAKKNGYPCVKYEIWAGGQKTRELWVTDWDNIEGGKDAVEAFESMAAFFRELMDAMPKMGGQSGMNNGFHEYMNELGGFPVVDLEFDDAGSVIREGNLKSANKQAINPDAFEPPSGYKRQSMMPN